MHVGDLLDLPMDHDASKAPTVVSSRNVSEMEDSVALTGVEGRTGVTTFQERITPTPALNTGRKRIPRDICAEHNGELAFCRTRLRGLGVPRRKAHPGGCTRYW